MATKNIARTAIEGGRIGSNKADRRIETQTERTRVRQELGFIRSGHGDPDADCFSTRRVVNPEFGDKLSPVKRWLATQCGRPWSTVYSEITKRFDRRSTPGRHIMDHIQQYMRRSPNDPYGQFRDFIVDDNGLLQKNPERVRYYSGSYRDSGYVEVKERDAVLTFLNGRTVRMVGKHLYWFEQTVGDRKLRWDWGKIVYESVWTSVAGLFLRSRDPARRQGKRLTAKEVRAFNQFSEAARSAVLAMT